MTKTLYQLRAGEKARIRSIGTDPVTKERLESLGMIEGVEVGMVRSTPLGNPRIFRALNTMIALRNDIAKLVEVEVADHE